MARKQNTREKRKFYLIVCEGDKTEPNYFRAFCKSLPQNVLDVYDIEIHGEGRNTRSLVNRAFKHTAKILRDNPTRVIDKVWVVFDKDDFSDDDFNTAIFECKSSKFNAAWSNEAFELWYLLHFNYYDTGLSRTQYKEKIEECFKHIGVGNFTYKKNDSDMYERLNGKTDTAIKNAKKLIAQYKGRHDYAKHSPCTRVHELVQELMKLQEFLAPTKK